VIPSWGDAERAVVVKLRASMRAEVGDSAKLRNSRQLRRRSVEVIVLREMFVDRNG
jgi:hypothetical protein